MLKREDSRVVVQWRNPEKRRIAEQFRICLTGFDSRRLHLSNHARVLGKVAG